MVLDSRPIYTPTESSEKVSLHVYAMPIGIDVLGSYVNLLLIGCRLLRASAVP